MITLNTSADKTRYISDSGDLHIMHPSRLFVYSTVGAAGRRFRIRNGPLYKVGNMSGWNEYTVLWITFDGLSRPTNLDLEFRQHD